MRLTTPDESPLRKHRPRRGLARLLARLIPAQPRAYDGVALVRTGPGGDFKRDWTPTAKKSGATR